MSFNQKVFFAILTLVTVLLLWSVGLDDPEGIMRTESQAWTYPCAEKAVAEGYYRRSEWNLAEEECFKAGPPEWYR